MTTDLLVQGVVAWLLLLSGTTLLLRMTLPLWQSRLRSFALRGQLAPFLFVAWAPAIMATLMLLGGYSPSLLAGAELAHDHCLHHTGHVHLCVRHVSSAVVTPFGAALLAGWAAWVSGGTWRLTRELRHGRRMGQALGFLEVACDAEGTCVVDAPSPVSLTAGVLWPRVFMSRSLIATLTEEQRRAVVAHEHCHARERHALIKLTTAVGALLHAPHLSKLLMSELSLACERRSDEAAAATVADRVSVASALLHTQRALASSSVALLPWQGKLELRVRSLLNDDALPQAGWSGMWATTVSLACAFALGLALHHGVESTLVLLLH